MITRNQILLSAGAAAGLALIVAVFSYSPSKEAYPPVTQADGVVVVEPPVRKYNLHDRLYSLEIAARTAVGERLKDPSSAEFRNIRINPDEFTVCGEVNAKTAFGGYSGSQRFIYRNDVVILQEDTAAGIDDFAVCDKATFDPV